MNLFGKKFKSYARRRQPHPIILELVSKFLIFGCEEKGWQVRTLLSYKSALAEPLEEALRVNLKHKYFARIFKSKL